MFCEAARRARVSRRASEACGEPAGAGEQVPSRILVMLGETEELEEEKL